MALRLELSEIRVLESPCGYNERLVMFALFCESMTA